MIIPGREPIPDGELTDLRHRAVVQRWPTDFGVGYNQLDALWLDATADGLFVGIEGLFEWGENAVEIWIDVDPGAGTGPASLAGSLTDPLGLVDRLLGATTLTAGAVDFAPDVAIAYRRRPRSSRRGSVGRRRRAGPQAAARSAR
jgi:hypothetical protein